jgi:hypothetical protein
VSATIKLHASDGGSRELGLGKDFLVVERPSGKYWLKLSPDEQKVFFKLLGQDPSVIFKRKGNPADR